MCITLPSAEADCLELLARNALAEPGEPVPPQIGGGAKSLALAATGLASACMHPEAVTLLGQLFKRDAGRLFLGFRRVVGQNRLVNGNGGVLLAGEPERVG